MAFAYKILGQQATAATTETSLYTASTEAAVHTITVCNRGGTAATFRIGLSQGGGALGNADYIYYDETVPANQTFAATFGIALAANDEIRVYASNANLSFSCWGTEIT